MEQLQVMLKQAQKATQ